MSYARSLLIWSLSLGFLFSGVPRDSNGTHPQDGVEDDRSTRLSDTASDGVQGIRTNLPSPVRRWQRSEASVALVQGNNVVWQFNYGPKLDTPYFHPVGTADGRVLSWNQPPDHAWHHAVWFSWKFINGVNYWEHNRQTGKPDGRTDWSGVRVRTRTDHSALISMALAYHPATDEEAVLHEQRSVSISAPDASGVYHMDWTCTFTAGAHEVTLDRTPPQEQAWGGYAGLSVRFAENFTQRRLVSSEGDAEFGTGDRHRSRAAAMDYNGLILDEPIGLAFLDHPKNPRHPTPWYAIRSPVMSYINAAILANEAMILGPGEQMTLRYRLIVHPNRWDAECLRAAHAQFKQSTVSPEIE